MMRRVRRFADPLETELSKMRAEGNDDEARMLETLAAVPFLEDVSPAALGILASGVGESVFPAGSIVVREGDADGVGFFVVVSGVGSVRVGDREIRTIRDGDHFGAVASIDGGPRTATVCATSELRCLILTAATLHELAHDHPGVAWKLLMYLAGLVRAAS